MTITGKRTSRTDSHGPSRLPSCVSALCRTAVIAVALTVAPIGCANKQAPGAGQGKQTKGQKGASLFVQPHEQPGRITVKDLFAKQSLFGTPPTRFAWSHDGTFLLFSKPSKEDAKVLDLWKFAKGKATLLVAAKDVTKHRAKLTEAQKSAMERKRVRHMGITSFILDKAGKGVLLPVAGHVYRYDLTTGKISDLFPKPAGEMDPTPSCDGTMVAFVRKSDLWLMNLATKKIQRLTKTGSATIHNGMAEFVAQEELERYRGFWWSKDGTMIAYATVDESKVPVVLRPQYGKKAVTVIKQRYPAAGKPNATVTLSVLNLKTHRTTKMDLGSNPDIYLARADWTKHGLTYQVLSRDQKQLELKLWDPKHRTTSVLLTDKDLRYVNLHHDFRPIADKEFVWSTEKTGVKRLWLHDWTGKPIRALSPKNMIVDDVQSAGPKGVLATVSTDRGRQRQVFFFPLAGGAPTRLTTRPGWHQVKVNRTGTAFVDRFSDLMIPPQVRVFTVSHRGLKWTAAVSAVLDDNPSPRLRKLNIHCPKTITIRADDGTKLNGLMFLPNHFDAKRRYPAVIYTYGGPHGQVAARRWRSSVLWHQFLADHGFVVLTFDGRGTGHRGKAFETKLYKKFGVVDVEDIRRAAAYLAHLPYVDAKRMGIWGWSYGGFLTVMTLLKTQRLFAAGLAVAPLADWHLYDTAYTERYLGLPASNEKVYQNADPLPIADRLTTHLMLIQGMADDNVLLRNSLQLIESFERHGIHFDMLYYPAKKHSIKGRAIRRHLLQTIASFFVRRLTKNEAQTAR